MNVSRVLKSWLFCFSAALTLTIGQPAFAATDTCGDLDGSGGLVASDALLLLKRAVGQNVAIECPDCSEPFCAELGEECNDNADCCPTDTPPPVIGGASATGSASIPVPCCGGTCQLFGICAETEAPCECSSQCCSGSCGSAVSGQCD